jgi:predicted helicase
LALTTLHPDTKHNWLNITHNDWDDLIPLVGGRNSVFDLYSNGIKTQRDEWVYDLSRENLEAKMRFFVEVYQKALEYNNHPDRLQIKWDADLQRYLERGLALEFDKSRITHANYRPYVKSWLYFDKRVNGRAYQLPHIFPAPGTKNLAIWWKTGADRPQFALAVDAIPDLLPAGGSVCFPFFRYGDSPQPIENITDWVLNQFQKHYKDKAITKTKIFYYVYAVLHHPAYREKYAINLKREFPRIPFYADFWQWADWGDRLMNLHLNYEQADPYPLAREDLPADASRRAYSPRLLARKDTGVIEVDTLTRLTGVPGEVYDYRLGTYSAVEWVLERYKEKTPKDPTIRERFNTYRFIDYKEHVIDLLARVTTVSVETMKIVGEMP